MSMVVYCFIILPVGIIELKRTLKYLSSILIRIRHANLTSRSELTNGHFYRTLKIPTNSIQASVS